MRLMHWLGGMAAATIATSCGLAQVIVDDAGTARNGKVGYWSSMVAKGGDAAISYYCEDDMNNSPPEAYTLRFAWATGTSWQWTTVDSGGSDTSMARGSDGLYQIAYQSWSGIGWATGTAATWSVSSVPTPAGIVPAHISMVLDSADHPHVAYMNLANGGDYSLRYTSFDGTQWHTSANQGIVALGAWTPTIGFSNTFLALDPAGTPHLAYASPTDTINAWGPIQYATLQNGVWQTEALGVSGEDPSLAIGSDGVPRLVFNGVAGITYAFKSGGVWQFETVVSGNSGSSLALALSAANQPYVSFGMTANEDMYLATRGGAWSLTRLDGDGTNNPHVILGRYGTSVTVDAAGTPHVSYLDIDIYSTTHRCDLKYFGPGGGGTPVCVAFARQPISTSLCAGGSGGFSTLVTGTGPFSYQWEWQLSSGQPWLAVLDGPNSNPQTGGPMFTASGAQGADLSVTDAGIGAASPAFRCTATAPCGAATSNAATLTLASPPVITSQPQGAQACSGGHATFQISVPGAPTLQWQVFDSWSGAWYDLMDGTNVWAGYACTVQGSGAASMTVAAAPQAPGAPPELYPMTVRCVATTACASVESSAASLTITGPCCGSADFNGDGDVGTDSDIEDFFACLAGNCCDTCGSVDFNNDGDVGTDSDIEAFFRVLAGGGC